MPISVKCRCRKEEALFGEIASIVYGFQKIFGVGQRSLYWFTSISLVTTINLQSDWQRALVFEFKFEVPACRYLPFLRFIYEHVIARLGSIWQIPEACHIAKYDILGKGQVRLKISQLSNVFILYSWNIGWHSSVPDTVENQLREKNNIPGIKHQELCKNARAFSMKKKKKEKPFES